MKPTHDNDPDPAALNHLIAQIIVGAVSEDDQFRAFHRAFLDSFQLPCDAFIIGEPVSIIAFEYHGQPRRGLTARCRREDGSEHTIAAADIVLTERAPGIQLLAAYRHWLGLDDRPNETTGPKRPGRRHKASARDINTSRPVELAVLSLKDTIPPTIRGSVSSPPTFGPSCAGRIVVKSVNRDSKAGMPHSVQAVNSGEALHMPKPKRKLTAAEKRARKERQKNFMTIFIPTLDGTQLPRRSHGSRGARHERRRDTSARQEEERD
ncbi:MAG: hypothetical protein FJ276_29585 [Planctomycetes bacterium]|nr:hypothetical protein [Planctomycetota bacterium]